MHRTQRVHIERPGVAIAGMFRQIPPVLPYVAVVVVIVLLYEYLLDTKLNEITAPTIMPVMMILIVIFDKMLMGKASKAADKPKYAAHRQDAVEGSIRIATTETVGHIGALITLMGLSMAVAGMVERSEVMQLAPHHFPNIWIAMTFLVVTKVILGMIMDPFGAIFLVSSTLAPIAYANGIDPVHFWMMVLVAFELGYLLPPVALNQLLTRQVVGDDEVNLADHEVRNKSFFRRYERWILPSVVMTVGLAIVAYVPLIVMRFEIFAPIKNWLAY
jgi:TRAP-type mannitol/chloroaromatic compound transport system permease large subunit